MSCRETAEKIGRRGGFTGFLRLENKRDEGFVATRRRLARVPRFGEGGVAEGCDRNKGIGSHELSESVIVEGRELSWYELPCVVEQWWGYGEGGDCNEL